MGNVKTFGILRCAQDDSKNNRKGNSNDSSWLGKGATFPPIVMKPAMDGVPDRLC